MLLDFGLLVLRLTLGLVIAAHGAQKLFGWFGGGGLVGMRKMMESLNIRPPMLWAFIAAICEFGGGLFTVFGFLMPLGPVMIIANMLAAFYYVHWTKGFWLSKGGYEYVLTLGMGALALGITGPGIFSLDALWRIAVPELQALIVGLVIVLITLGILSISSHRFASTQKHATT